MSLVLTNSLSRKKEEFKPIEPGKVSLYVCGVTVYDYCHIGHARAYVSFDLLRRVLEQDGYEVTHIQNFTDIDDKIIKRANDRKQSCQALTQRYIDAYFEDMDALNIKRATAYPKATDYIAEMIALIQSLIEKDVAYKSKNGAVYFSVAKKDDYGKLSNKVIEDLIAGSRVEVEEGKDQPLDFVLWKPAKEGEPSWDSPWGAGRPGWHLECSAMAIHALGDSMDIHAGGEDLLFPHHENEIAQSECATGKPFANYWMHNGFVTIDEEKMSKSTGNFFSIRDILKTTDAEVLRFFLQKVHYKAPLRFSPQALEESRAALERLRTTLRNVPEGQAIPPEHLSDFERIEAACITALKDDLNTSEATATLFEMSKLINTIGAGSERLKALGQLMGLFYTDLAQGSEIPSDIQALLQQRNKAKAEKNFEKADQLREQILQAGYSIEDSREGSTLRPV